MSNKKRAGSFITGLLGIALCAAVSCYGQNEKRFATQGVVELGGSASFQSITPVSNGVSGGNYTVLSLSPYFGYFVSDGFELGVNPFGITLVSTNGGSLNQVSIFAAPSYNFTTQSAAYPFIEGLIGYTSQSDGSTRNGVSWGFRGGAKVAIVNQGLLNLGLQYIQYTLDPSGAANRYGSNNFSLLGGFSVWL